MKFLRRRPLFAIAFLTLFGGAILLAGCYINDKRQMDHQLANIECLQSTFGDSDVEHEVTAEVWLKQPCKEVPVSVSMPLSHENCEYFRTTKRRVSVLPFGWADVYVEVEVCLSSTDKGKLDVTWKPVGDFVQRYVP